MEMEIEKWEKWVTSLISICMNKFMVKQVIIKSRGSIFLSTAKNVDRVQGGESASDSFLQL